MELGSIYSDGAVFQRRRPILVQGQAHGRLRATFAGERRQLQANGAFCLAFSPREAGGPYEMCLSDDQGSLTLHDVYVGEVILLAGQSNAELPVAQTSARGETFADDDGVRLFLPTQPTVDEQGRLVPAASALFERWCSLRSAQAGEWPAMALHIAQQLRAQLQMAVGIVGCFKGATVIESFLSEQCNRLFPLQAERLMTDHFDPAYAWNAPAFLYHFMLQKLVPWQVDAVVWYQGESNRTVYEGGIYDRMLEALIEEWRALFRAPALPFAVVQINLFPGDGDAAEPGVHAIRAAQQRAVQASAHCRLVRIDDLGEHEKIHPENKRAVSQRVCAALQALWSAPRA